MLTNPRFGTRRWSGIWPPSNHAGMLPPERAFCPLQPRVEYRPCPEPGPHPIRLLFFVAPLAGFDFAQLHRI